MARAFLSAFLLFAASAASAERPRLVVLVSVDQMRADYLTRFSGELSGGLARLLRDGAAFTRARQAHVPTETAPGHATLATGREPAEHGVIANDWWDPVRARVVYSVEDPEFGVGPGALRAPTLGDALKEAFPAAKVAAIAGKDRAAVLMGGRRADVALWYDRGGGAFTTSGYYGAPPPWLLDWDAENTVEPEARATAFWDIRLDRLTLDLARRAVREMSLGSDPVCDLLAVSLSATDYLGHRKGPDDPAMRAHILRVDAALGDFLDFLDSAVGEGRYALALSADHGVAPLPESGEGRRRGLRRLLYEDYAAPVEAGLARRFGHPPRGRRWVASVITPHVHLDRALARERGVPEAELLQEAARLLAEQPATLSVHRPDELSNNGSSYAEDVRASYDPERSGDLLVVTREGFLVTDHPTEAGHGLPYDDDARVPMILFGAGVRPGRYAREVSAADLAPTLARLAGADLAPRAGRTLLREALRDRRPLPAPSPAPAFPAAPALRPLPSAK